MHVPDHVLDPGTVLSTASIAACGLGYAAYAVSRDVATGKVRIVGVVAAWVFAAQMLNFPVVDGVSGHLIGAVLAAIVLGRWAGMLAVSAVLLIQCLLFEDGGLTALGANIINMAMIGSLIGYSLYDQIQQRIDGNAGKIVGAMAASWVSVMLGSAFCSWEIAGTDLGMLSSTLPAMLFIHGWIGIGEAVICGTAVAILLAWQPQLLHRNERAFQKSPPLKPALHAIAAMALLFVIASPFASSMPDGLEATLSAIGFTETSVVLSSPMPDYRLQGVGEASMVSNIVPGMIGIVAVFATAVLATTRRNLLASAA